MKVRVQVYTSKGFYGEEIEVSGSTLKECLSKVVDAIDDELPDSLEGERVIDWTKIEVIAERV